MTRPIKFRAKRKDNGLWAYGHYIKTPISTEFSADGQFLDCGVGRHCIVQDGVAHEVDVATLGQFTGLLDKNGREIYEGDVVRSSDCLYEDVGDYKVRWGGDEAGFWLWTGKFKHCALANDEIAALHLEVIGNIHENPSLLSPKSGDGEKGMGEKP